MYIFFFLFFFPQDSVPEQKTAEPGQSKGKGKGKGKKGKNDKPEQKDELKSEPIVITVEASVDAETRELEELSKQAAEAANTGDEHYDNAESFVTHVADLEGT